MLSVVVLAAGQGTRMVSQIPKILHPLGGKPLIHHVLDRALSLHPEEVIVVLSPHIKQEEVIGNRSVRTILQDHPKGTGHATMMAVDTMEGEGTVLILCGDTPLIPGEDLQILLDHHHRSPEGSITLLGGRFEDPRHYGRIVSHKGKIEKIIEYKDASEEERKIPLCNTGIIATSLRTLKTLLPQLKANNKAQEYYLTDLITLAASQGIDRYVVETQNIALFHGINNRVELADAERQYQRLIRHQMMVSGVTLLDPETVYFSHDTVVGKETVIHPYVSFGEKVRIGEHVILYPHCHLSHTTLEDHTKVGPFAHLREETLLKTGAEVGNFVEIKKSTLEEGAKAKHLSYLGDAIIGSEANIGAGVITCNYNGVSKHPTYIGERAFIGSNCALVAPVSVGAGAVIGAGSVIDKDVPINALGIARGKQENIPNWAESFGKNKKKEKK